MGTWSSALFGSDDACDARDAWVEAIRDGRSAAQAMAAVRQAVNLRDPHVGPVAWVALAVTQWEHGRLEPAVRDRALTVIHSGKALAWLDEAPKLRARFKGVLSRAAATLRKPMPKPKQLAPRAQGLGCRPGDIVAFTPKSGPVLVFHVAETSRDELTFHRFTWKSRKLPDPKRLGALKRMESRLKRGGPFVDEQRNRLFRKEPPRTTVVGRLPAHVRARFALLGWRRPHQTPEAIRVAVGGTVVLYSELDEAWRWRTP